jgi:hypothetical protein
MHQLRPAAAFAMIVGLSLALVCLLGSNLSDLFNARGAVAIA